jgi:tetratricopeptide (TPR) repeat protein/TolB-like protein
MKTIAMAVTLALLLAAIPAGAQSLVPVGARQLVIPFENAAHEPRLYWLAEASAVVLTDDLVALGAQALSRDDRLLAFEQFHVPPVATISDATIIRVGQVVGAEQVIVGSFDLKDDTLTVRARAIRLDTGRMFPEIAESGPLNDLFGVYARVARRIVPDSTVTTEQMERGHPSLPAFEQYVKGVLAENPATQASFLKEALRLAPDFQRARLALWTVYTEQGEHLQALNLVKQVPADHPLSREARFLAAISLMNLGRNADASAALIDLNREKPDAVLLNDAGVAQLRRAVGPGAAAVAAASEDLFKQAIAASPNDPDLSFNLGYAAWMGHDTPNAVASLREAVRRNPADDAAHYVLGVALQSSGSVAEGQREKDLAKRLSSTYVDWDAKQSGANAVPTRLERLKMQLDAANSPRMEDVIEASEQRNQRELAAFHLDSGRRLFQAERDAEAIAELRRAIYLSPYDREAHLLLGRLYLRGGRIQEAIDELKISIWSNDQIDAHLALADGYTQAKNVAAARTELQAVLARDPMNADARRMLDALPQP